MPNRWSQEENEVFIRIMPAYRQAIGNQSKQRIKQITEEYVSELLSVPMLSSRSRQAVYEHLTYFDDLLEGIGTTDNYGDKDSIYFGKLKSGTRTTQHPLRVLRNRSYYLNSQATTKSFDNPTWINIDIPLRTCTVHSDTHCIYIEKKKETPYKGIESLRRDGGWLRFKTMEDVNRFYLVQYPLYKRIDHCQEDGGHGGNSIR